MSIPKNTAVSIPFFAVDKTTGKGKSLLSGFAVSIARDGSYVNPIMRVITEIGDGGYWLALTAADTDCDVFYLAITHPDAIIGVVTCVTDVPVSVTTQQVDLSELQNVLAAVKTKIDTLPESFVEVVTQQVNVTQETVSVTTQTVDLSGVTQTLGQIKTQTDKIPNSPATTQNIPSVTDIAQAVGRRQIANNPPLLSMDGLVLAALSSVTEPNVGNPNAGTLRVKNPDGSTLGTLSLGVEPAATAKIITGVNP